MKTDQPSIIAKHSRGEVFQPSRDISKNFAEWYSEKFFGILNHYRAVMMVLFVVLGPILFCCFESARAEGGTGWYNSYSRALESKFVTNYSDDSGSDGRYIYRWRLRDQDDFLSFLDLTYGTLNDEVGVGIKTPKTLFDNTRFEYTVLPQFTPRLALIDGDGYKAKGIYLEWETVSARTRIHAGFEDSEVKASHTEDRLWLGYVEQDFSTHLFGGDIVDNQFRLLVGISDQDSEGRRQSAGAFLKTKQIAVGAGVGDHQYFGVLSRLTDNYGYRTRPTGRLLFKYNDGTGGEPDRLVVDGLVVLSRFSKVNAGFSAGAIKGQFYDSLGKLVSNRNFDSPAYVTDLYQLGRYVFHATSVWVDDDNKRNTQEVYVTRFSRIGMARGAHVGFIRTEEDGKTTTGTLQLGVDGLQFLPSGMSPTGLNELPKILLNLTADTDYLKGDDGFYKIDIKIEYDF